MPSIKKVKEMLGDKNMSDGEAKEIRDGFYNLAEIIFEKCKQDKQLTKKDNT